MRANHFLLLVSSLGIFARSQTLVLREKSAKIESSSNQIFNKKKLQAMLEMQFKLIFLISCLGNFRANSRAAQ